MGKATFFPWLPTKLSSIDLTTPAVLFPAISLLLLAYTNRFLALASIGQRLGGRLGWRLKNSQACSAKSMS